jgi:hypothetical protein
VKWGQPALGPYAWTTTETRAFGVDVGIVNIPQAFAESGLAGWAALPHEASGQAMALMNDGLIVEMADRVRRKIRASSHPALPEEDEYRDALAEYCSIRACTAASDLIPVTNIGPAAAVGLIAYLRASGAATHGSETLLAEGAADDPHPPGAARCYLAAYDLGLCSFGGAQAWRDLTVAETTSATAPGQITLAGRIYTNAALQAMAWVVAEAILNTPMEAPGDKRVLDLLDWAPRDEQIVQSLTIHSILGPADLPSSTHGTFRAAHGVGAAVMASLMSGLVGHAHRRMVDILSALHRSNATWSPLSIVRPRDIAVQPFATARQHVTPSAHRQRGDEGNAHYLSTGTAASIADKAESSFSLGMKARLPGYMTAWAFGFHPVGRSGNEPMTQAL